MTGIGIIIILFQIYPFMGYKSAKSTIKILAQIYEPLSSLNWMAIGLGAMTIAIIYLFPKVTKVVPSALVALLAATMTAYYLKLDIPLIGEIPSGLPSLQIEGLFSIVPSMTWMIIEFAATIAALGAIDSLLTSVIADNITKTKHNSHRELIGQGIGNIASGLIGGLPGAGATMRTIVNVNAGGKTRLSGLTHSLLLFTILLGLGKYAACIPMCVLAGILITFGIGIVDYHKGLRYLFHVPRADAVILIIVMAITVFENLIHAVGVGVVLACVLFMKKESNLAKRETTVTPLGNLKEEELWEEEKACTMNTRTRYI
jgi:SulP family sulfate permease